MSLGSDLALQTLSLINEFGRSVTYNRITNGSYNPATSTFSQGQANTTINALVEEEKDIGKNQSLAVVASKKLSIAANSFAFTPTVVDTITMAGQTYVIQDIDTYLINALPVLYQFHITKA
jgi:hypothetical protein